ncbi:MAG: endolytic transglycosylase MltG [Oscillospiraceae bacterium]|jgi:UPF0755 protein|nr:endolytic transglycosylase MltG [Oscillospiraceae bacterium]
MSKKYKQKNNSKDISSFSSEYKKKASTRSRFFLNDGNKDFFFDQFKSIPKFLRFVWLSMIFSLSCLFSQFFVFGINDMLAVGRENSEITLEIPKDSNLSNLAKLLAEKGIIKEKDFFRVYVIATRSFERIVSGTFNIKTNLDYEAIVNFFSTNSNRSQDDVVRVSFPEGSSVVECADLLEKNKVCEKKGFLEACKSTEFNKNFEFLNNLPNDKHRIYRLEGFLFPDTYDFYKNSKPKDVVPKFLNNYETKIYKKTKEKNKKIIKNSIEEKELNLSDVLIIASIIQSEASDNEDMYIISSVFKNRLKTMDNGGISKFSEDGLDFLCSDPTVWYPYKNKESVPVSLKNFEGAYNTYKHKGLPSGPICNPGLKAIDAAINPKETEYYYFCHSRDRKSFFAKTRPEHQENLKKAGLAD